jgi:hypothetical protein
VNTKLRPLTGVGLQLFRGWLYAPFSVAFGAIGIGIFTSPHLDKVGIGMALAILAIGLAYVLWTRRIEKTFGHGNLFVQTTLGTFGLMVLLWLLYPIMSHQIHMRFHPKSPENSHWEMLIIINYVFPMMLLRTKWPENWPKRS